VLWIGKLAPSALEGLVIYGHLGVLGEGFQLVTNLLLSRCRKATPFEHSLLLDRNNLGLLGTNVRVNTSQVWVPAC
jgi:hypothetical protein